MSLKVLRTIMVITSISTSLGWAADLRVPEVYSTLKQALQASNAGDRILLSQSITIAEQTDALRQVTIEGVGQGITVYIANGGNLFFYSLNQTTVKNINFSNISSTSWLNTIWIAGGNVKFYKCSFFGGTYGINCSYYRGSVLLTLSCNFYNCSAAISASWTKSVRIQSCNFYECQKVLGVWESEGPNVSSTATFWFCGINNSFHNINIPTIDIGLYTESASQPYIFNLNYCSFNVPVNPYSYNIETADGYYYTRPATQVNTKYCGWYRADKKTYRGPYQLYEEGNYFND